MTDGEVIAWFFFGGVALICATCLIAIEVRKGPGKSNRRRGLPAPRPDERNSIEQFKRIIQ